jgi:hypothetical protein
MIHWSWLVDRPFCRFCFVAAIMLCGFFLAGVPDVHAVTSSACVSERGFEEPALAAGFRAYIYNPTGTPWTYVGGAGISRPPNSFTPNRPPEGDQAAFLQNEAGATSICRELSGLTASTVYHLTFLYGGRAGQPNQVGCTFCNGANPFDVRINGATIATFTSIPLETYVSTTLEFTASGGSTELCFVSLSMGVRDLTTFFDDVKIEECSATKLFIVSSQGEQSTSDPSNEVFRFAIGGPADDPVLETAVRHTSLDHPFGLAFGPDDEMFVINRGMGQTGQGSISRFHDPTGLHPFNATILSPFFSSPQYANFRDRELFIGQRFADNVIRFLIDQSGNASFNGFITDGLGNDAVRGVAFNPSGDELFVTECCGVDEVNRYLIDASGDAVPNGTITGNGLSSPHDLVFSDWGELFVGNDGQNTISRFVFDGAGNASANGVISGNGLNRPASLAFSPWDELFAANLGDPSVSRWRFDGSFNAMANGTFVTRTTNGDIAFVAGDDLPIDTPTPTTTGGAVDTPTPTATEGPVDTETPTATSEVTVATLTPTPTDDVTPPSTSTPTATSDMTPDPTLTPTDTEPVSTSTPTATRTATVTGTPPTATPTTTGTITPPTPTPTGEAVCVGDCDENGVVLVNEVIVCVNIALERAALSSCPACACEDNLVNISCLVTSVNALLRGCL